MLKKINKKYSGLNADVIIFCIITHDHIVLWQATDQFNFRNRLANGFNSILKSYFTIFHTNLQPRATPKILSVLDIKNCADQV